MSSSLLTELRRFFVSHLRVLTLATGTATIALWTLFRHITNGVNFDVVGQIGLADQWAHGLHGGTQLGVTNYVLKIPFYFLVNLLDFISPMNRLLLLALVFNITTFLLLFMLFEKILKLYAMRDKRWLYLGMVWLASISGAVFWIDYANSRNLETVGGVLFLYIILKFLRKSSLQTALLGIVIGSFVFFADSLEFYVFGVGVCVYMLGRFVRTRTKDQAKLATSVMGITGLAYVGSKLIAVAISAILKVDFLKIPYAAPSLDTHTLSATAHGLLTSTLEIFGANFLQPPYSANTLRELLGFLTLSTLTIVGVRYWKKLQSRAVLAMGLSIIIVNYAVYVASGQSLVWATSRYLILVPLTTVLLVAFFGDAMKRRTERRIQLSLVAATILSILLLVGAVVIRWPERHAKDMHIYVTAKYLKDNRIRYVLSSREIGVTTTYFAQGSSTVLPALCESGNQLVATDLFYDRAAFEKLKDQASVAVLIPEDGIRTNEHVCTPGNIVAQFGPPKNIKAAPGVGTLLFYDSSAVASALPEAFSD